MTTHASDDTNETPSVHRSSARYEIENKAINAVYTEIKRLRDASDSISAQSVGTICGTEHALIAATYDQALACLRVQFPNQLWHHKDTKTYTY